MKKHSELSFVSGNKIGTNTFSGYCHCCNNEIKSGDKYLKLAAISNIEDSNRNSRIFINWSEFCNTCGCRASGYINTLTKNSKD